MYRSDRIGGRGEGAAILVHLSVKLVQNPLAQIYHREATHELPENK
jgi:hypothetical protein